jgi:hypothetical protein
MTGQEVQREIFQKMTPEQKLHLSMRLYYSAWELKSAWLRQIHPDWTQEQIQQEVRRIFTNAGN